MLINVNLNTTYTKHSKKETQCLTLKRSVQHIDRTISKLSTGPNRKMIQWRRNNSVEIHFGALILILHMGEEPEQTKGHRGAYNC